MFKHIIALFFVLSFAFACGSPYAVKFSSEFSYPAMDPKLAAITAPSVSDRLDYGLSKMICSNKPLKSLDSAVSSIIESGFFKNLAEAFGPLKTIKPVLGQLPTLLTNSLSSQALGFGGSKTAMRAAIGAAISSKYSCDSIEKAAEIYYNYDRVTYFSDLCGNSDTLKTIMSLLEKQAPEKLKATTLTQDLSPYFIDIFNHNEVLASKVMNREMDRKTALKTLAKNLDDLPLCHEATKKYVNTLISLASIDSPLFFPLYDEIYNFRKNCPLNFSGYYLEKISGDSLYFSNGKKTYPLLEIKESLGVKVLERHPNAPFTFNISGIAPISGTDKYFDTSIMPSEKKSKLSFGFAALVLMSFGLLFGLWVRAKKT